MLSKKIPLKSLNSKIDAHQLQTLIRKSVLLDNNTNVLKTSEAINSIEKNFRGLIFTKTRMSATPNIRNKVSRSISSKALLSNKPKGINTRISIKCPNGNSIKSSSSKRNFDEYNDKYTLEKDFGFQTFFTTENLQIPSMKTMKLNKIVLTRISNSPKTPIDSLIRKPQLKLPQVKKWNMPIKTLPLRFRNTNWNNEKKTFDKCHVQYFLGNFKKLRDNPIASLYAGYITNLADLQKNEEEEFRGRLIAAQRIELSKLIK